MNKACYSGAQWAQVLEASQCVGSGVGVWPGWWRDDVVLLLREGDTETHDRWSDVSGVGRTLAAHDRVSGQGRARGPIT